MNEQEALEKWQKEAQFREIWRKYRSSEGFSKSLLYTLEITHKCFLRCSHCFAEASPDNNEFLQPDLVDSLAEDSVSIFGKYNSRSIRITGGDAFLHPDLDDIVRSFSLRRERLGGPLIDVETSGGWAVTDEHTYDRIRKLKEAGADCISMTNDYWHQVQEVFPNSEHGERIKKFCEEIGIKFRYITIPLPVLDSITASNNNGILSLEFIPESVPIGRARDLPEKYWTNFCGDTNECKLVPTSYERDIMFDPLGNVYLCYSGKCFPNASLSIGNLHDKPISQILNLDFNPIIRLLTENGIRGLTETAGLSLVQHYELLKKMGQCGTCHEVLRKYGRDITDRLTVNA